MQSLIRRLTNRPPLDMPEPIVSFAGLERALREDKLVLPKPLRRPARILSRTTIRIPAWLRGRGVAALFAATLLYGLTLGGQGIAIAGHLTSAIGLKIDEIKVTGQVETGEGAVIDALGLGGHASMVALDVSEARARLLALPWVSDASIRKTYPGAVVVELEERTALALWQSGQTVSLIDQNGHLIDRMRDPKFANLVLLVGKNANSQGPEFLQLLTNFPGLMRRTRAAVLVADRRWNLVMDSGVEVRLPEKDPALALARLADIERRERVLEKDILALDLRVAGQMAVRLREPAIEEHRTAFEQRAKELKRETLRAQEGAI